MASVVGYFAVTGGLQPAQSIADLMEPAKLDMMRGASFVGIPYFRAHPEGAAAVNVNSETVFIEMAKQLSTPGSPACCWPPFWAP